MAKTTKKSKATAPASGEPGSARAQQVLKDAWARTATTLAAAESELQKQVRKLREQGKPSVEEAGAALKRFRQRLETERKRGAKELARRLRELQTRVERDRDVVAKRATDAVQSGLAALNIPSRREVALLTRKVDELSRKIDGLGRKGKTRKAASR